MMINQYNSEGSVEPSEPSGSGMEIDKNKLLLLLGGIVVAILIVVAAFSFIGGNDSRNNPERPAKTNIVCGDGVCEGTENCVTCAKDCGCEPGEECDALKKACVEKESTLPEGSVCGDGTCDTDENCFDCGRDCGCEAGEYCSTTEKVCVKPVCGNNKCESKESPYSCCLDCFCVSPGEECNTESKKCELIVLSITENRAKELIQEYYQTQGKTVVSMNVRGPWKWDDVPIMLVEVSIEGQDWPDKVGVYEDETVYVLPSH